MTTWDDCPEKWYLGYNLMLKKEGTYAMYFIYGDGVHDTLERWYKSKGEDRTIATLQFPGDVFPTQQEEDDLYKMQLLLNVQMERYFEYYADDLKEMQIEAVEEEFDIEFHGVRLKGKVDLQFSSNPSPPKGSGLCITDHKTGSSFDPIGWEYRFQFMFYAWMAQQRDPERPIDWFMINGIKKPLLRLGKTESVESYCERVRADMISEPTKYFHRHWLDIQPVLKRFEERTLMPKINRIKLLTQAKDSDILVESLVRQQNTNHCVKFGNKQKCQFLDICKNGWEAEGFAFTQRETKHQELDSTEE